MLESWSLILKEKKNFPSEFELIDRLFRPLAAANIGSASLQDDCSTMPLKQGYEALYTMDTLVEGIHFYKEDPADLIAKKLLRVNLSDLAASGGKVRGYLLALSLPHQVSLTWLESFVGGLREDQSKFNVCLLGGDTTSTQGPITLSMTAIGEVPVNQAVRRSGANPGDDIYVTGCIGDAALALKLFEDLGREETLQNYPDLYEKYVLPDPPTTFGSMLPSVATACIDISDGFCADLAHICLASNVGAEVELAKIPLSVCAQQLIRTKKTYSELVFSGGDDYELLFTAKKDKRNLINGFGRQSNTLLSRVGSIKHNEGVLILDRVGNEVLANSGGWQHF